MIKGDTKTVAITPIGLNVPKRPSEIGAVKICAPQEALIDVEKYGGKTFIMIFVRYLLVIKMPESAP